LHDQDVPKYILNDVEEERKQTSAIFDKLEGVWKEVSVTVG